MTESLERDKTMPQEITERELKRRIFAYLESHPKSKANAVCEAIRGDKTAALRILSAGVATGELLKEKGFWNAQLHSVTEKGRLAMQEPEPEPTPVVLAVERAAPDLGTALLQSSRAALTLPAKEPLEPVQPVRESLASPTIELPTMPSSPVMTRIPDAATQVEMFQRVAAGESYADVMAHLSVKHPELFVPIESVQHSDDVTPATPQRRDFNPNRCLTGYDKPSGRSVWVKR